MLPDEHGWTKQNMLLAEILDTLHWLQWAQTKDGQRNRNRPRRVPRPGVTPQKRPGANPKPAPLSVIKRIFGKRYARQTDAERAERLKTIFD